MGFDPRPEVTDVPDLAGLAAALTAPRVVWVMVPSGEITQQTIADLADVLEAGDLVIDGGNSRYTDDQAHAISLEPKGIRYLDVGVSGGVWGLTEGYALMVGGDAETVTVARAILSRSKRSSRHSMGPLYIVCVRFALMRSSRPSGGLPVSTAACQPT